MMFLMKNPLTLINERRHLIGTANQKLMTCSAKVMATLLQIPHYSVESDRLGVEQRWKIQGVAYFPRCSEMLPVSSSRFARDDGNHPIYNGVIVYWPTALVLARLELLVIFSNPVYIGRH